MDKIELGLAQKLQEEGFQMRRQFVESLIHGEELEGKVAEIKRNIKIEPEEQRTLFDIV